MDYIEWNIKLDPRSPWSEILVAELGEEGFDSFVDTEEGVQAYIPMKQREDLQDLKKAFLTGLEEKEVSVSIEEKIIPHQNWNAQWEESFDPVDVEDLLTIRAPFHKAENRTKMEVVIQPQMSFGTGHHQTTHLMLEHLLELEINDQDVLDMGSGTAVLAIMACKRGARKSTAIDIDAWCGENGLENAQRNGIENIEVLVGTAEQLPKTPVYDLIIANINRNVLLEDMPAYVACLRGGGVVLLSGFYEADLDIITQRCHECGLVYQHHKTKDNWVAAKFLFL